jgi:prepilin-type N-terminal cleavage/methylation domain-containing protein
MKKNSKNKKGFSFIELMITIAIMAIMTTVTLVSMNKGRELWAVKTAAREVAATVREVQNNALTGKGLTASSASCNYTFSWTTAATPPANVYNITGCRTQSYTLKNGVSFSGSGGSLSFSVPFSITSEANIKLNKGSSDYYVCVYASGIVKEDPVGC